jgi:molybdate/tungstate transport system substrate-binding protein
MVPAAATRRLRACCAVAMLALLVAGCGGSPAPSGDGPRPHGTVRVLYAASLLDALENQVGPAFRAATGYAFSGYPGASTALANEETGGVYQGDVFISASPAVNGVLEKSGFESWYATFGSTRLVLGYNPRSRFAAALRSRPWYRVIREPGIQVGRTDPALDPKGALTVTALTAAQRIYHLPGFAAGLERSSIVFPEEDLLGRLEAGQLDAGFYYTLETAAAHIPTVSLGAAAQSTTFTVAMLRGAPDRTAAVAFVRYLLGPARAILRADGFTPQPPHLYGSRAAVPAALRSLFGTGR